MHLLFVRLGCARLRYIQPRYIQLLCVQLLSAELRYDPLPMSCRSRPSLARFRLGHFLHLRLPPQPQQRPMRYLERDIYPSRHGRLHLEASMTKR